MLESEKPPQDGSNSSLVANGYHANFGTNGQAKLANGRSQEPAADAGFRSMLSIAERRDLILFLMRLEATFDQDELFRDAINYFLREVLLRKFLLRCQADAPIGNLVLEALAVACERDQQFGDAIRERLRRILGDQHGESCQLPPQEGG